MGIEYVALLRGINVGGRNRMPMAELRACFESGGYHDVRTWIQSGNVLFRAEEGSRDERVSAIERLLTETFDYRASVEIQDREEMREVVGAAPPGFGREPDRYLSDVLFLMSPVSPDEVLAALTMRDGVDAAWPGPNVVYSRRLKARASRSGLSRIASHPSYQRMTIRSWSTTTKLLALMDEA